MVDLIYINCIILENLKLHKKYLLEKKYHDISTINNQYELEYILYKIKSYSKMIELQKIDNEDTTDYKMEVKATIDTSPELLLELECYNSTDSDSVNSDSVNSDSVNSDSEDTTDYKMEVKATIDTSPESLENIELPKKTDYLQTCVLVDLLEKIGDYNQKECPISSRFCHLGKDIDNKCIDIVPKNSEYEIL